MNNMSPLQTRILQLVRRAGPGGMAGDVLFLRAYAGDRPRYRGGRMGKGETRQRNALKANIWHLNQQLDHHGWRIVGSHCAGGWYWLVRS